MSLAFEDLDGKTRDYMLAEIERDISDGSIYISSYLNARGCARWPDMIREAARNGNDATLSERIRHDDCLNSHHEYDRRSTKGVTRVRASVPHNASQTMGEGEFNRYFTRGLCLRAITEGIRELEVYRAKPVAVPRPESEAKIGLRVDPQVILDDLRASKGVETALGIPPGPNTGITLRIPKK